MSDKISITNKISESFIEKISNYFKRSKNFVTFIQNLYKIKNTNDKLHIDERNKETIKILLKMNLKNIKECIIQTFADFSNSKDNVSLNEHFINNISRIYNNINKYSQGVSTKLVISTPNITWKQIGGLEPIKGEIKDIITIPSKYPHLFLNIPFKKRSGLILYGPPGTGKTLIAKAIANESLMNFISIKGPELLNMYVGESEKNIKTVFQEAKLNSPCVLFFDEIDSLCPIKSQNCEQSNIMDRIVSQFLVEIDDIDYSKEKIFLVGATNRPDLIEPSLLRPGRFDKCVYVDIPTEFQDKLKIFLVHTNKFKIQKDVSNREIVNMFKKGYSGADIYEVCKKAFIKSLKRYIQMKKGDYVIISKEDFIESIRNTEPSVEQKNIINYKLIK